MLLTDWTVHFPNLEVHGYKRTSNATDIYNCFAWAAGESQRRWEPDSFGLFYWPRGVTRTLNRTTAIEAYGTLGYVVCASSDLEDGFEKIAIYFLNKNPTHAARQLPNGNWTSKLGDGDDIEHTLDGLNGNSYGIHQVYMKREIRIPA